MASPTPPTSLQQFVSDTQLDLLPLMQNYRKPQQQYTTPFTNLAPPSDEVDLLFTPPGHRLTFIDNKQGVRRLSAENAAKHRHAIFTAPKETERQHMSDEVINSLSDQDPGRALLDLERFESITNDIAPFSLFRGPFGVSKLPPLSEPEDTSPESNDGHIPFDDWFSEPSTFPLPVEEIDFFSSLIHDPGEVLNDNTELWNLIPSPPRDIEGAFEMSPSPPDIVPMHFNENVEAWAILSYYKEKIVPLISPFEHGQEAPWGTLVVSCAVNTLGETVMNGNPSNARFTLLHALLSASSFHMGQHSAMEVKHWITTGEAYLKRAEHHFMRCIEEAYTSATKKSKYKEVLMAILSLSTAYMIKGDPEKRLACLIQAEKFINANGFSQSNLSPKRRALHHCYAYMRIMAETTSIDSLSTQLANTSLSDDGTAHADFRISRDIAFSDNIMAMEKDPNVAQRDLHLAIPGRWSLTLFPKMYGVAESFLMLLSQVIRLANERDLSMREGKEGMLNLKEFWTRAKAIEKGIHLLVSSCRTGYMRNNFEDENQSEAANIRAQTMYTALLIFFHRRIYDLDAALLQTEVDAVRDSLETIQQGEVGQDYGNTASLIWPAFIAACEAVSPASQLFFSAWFDRCYATTGLSNVALAKQVFETIWTKRRETGLYGEMCSWPEVLRAKKIRLMCT
ncbi:hypothetical protein N7532_004374 [Penicillium argentinense]|uniref:Arginine metabolism regulation protein II n=1 Tax=Penicillium argentinense TaxID=1131581 RepID=A0A9W9KES3_9EURO|nr:uncharacterized protein N7532_004374 [Penicillium argentinense]KAJ5103845.1 hypothetical protein N7532_004374 [Penicillium argentinense]